MGIFLGCLNKMFKLKTIVCLDPGGWVEDTAPPAAAAVTAVRRRSAQVTAPRGTLPRGTLLTSATWYSSDLSHVVHF